jgi:soluble P-type ATPase
VLAIDIPSFGALRLEHLVLDFNGTLAIDGRLIPGVRERLNRLAASLAVHVITADTFGRARAALRGEKCTLQVLGRGAEHRAKAAFVSRLGANGVACIGNGRNDRLMLAAAALGIVTIQREGAAGEAVAASDVVVHDVRDALELLLRPRRLLATLRS